MDDLQNMSAENATGTKSYSSRIYPWLQYLLLGLCFFLVVHDPLASTYELNQGAEAYAATAGSGSMQRQIGFASLIALALILMSRRKPLAIAWGELSTWIVLALGGWTFLSVLWTQAPSASLTRLGGLLILIAVAYAVTRCFQPEDTVRFIALATLSYIAIGVGCELYLSTFHPWTSDYRFCGTLTPNEQGINCALSCLASLYLWRTDPQKRYWMMATWMTLVFCILSKSRTSLLALVVTVLVVQTIRQPNWQRRVTTWAVLSIVLSTLAWVAYNRIIDLESVIQMGRDNATSPAESLTGRLPLWSEIGQIAEGFSILGCGFGAFWTPDRITEISHDQHWGVSAAHNAYLDIWIGLGPIGLMLFVAALWFSARRAIRTIRSGQKGSAAWFFLALIVFTALDGLADSGPVEVSSFLCFCLTVSVVQQCCFPVESRESTMKSLRHQPNPA